MRRLALLLLIALPCSAQTWSTWNGATVGSSTGNASSMNGKTIGTSTGNYNQWNNLASPGGGGGGPAVVQSKSNGVGIPQPSSLAFAGSITSGHVILAVMYAGAFGDTLTASDSLGNTFTTLASAGLATDSDAIAIACAPVTTGGTDTVSFLTNGVQAPASVAIYEVSGATCTQDVTAVHSNTTGATSCNSGPMTTTTPNDFLVAICGTDDTATSIPAGSGWSGGLLGYNSAGTSISMMTQYRVATTTGSYTATSGTFPSEEQATLLVALKP